MPSEDLATPCQFCRCNDDVGSNNDYELQYTYPGQDHGNVDANPINFVENANFDTISPDEPEVVVENKIDEAIKKEIAKMLNSAINLAISQATEQLIDLNESE